MSPDETTPGDTPEARPDDTPADGRAAAQRRWWLAGVVAVIALLVVTIAVFASGGDDDDAAPPTTAGSIDLGATSVPVTDATTTPDATTDATTEGTDDTAAGSTEPTTATTPAAATSTTAGGATTTVASTVPPVSFVPGNGDTVPVQTVDTQPPVSIDDVADAGTGMQFRLERLEAVQGEANGPGEIAGPAVRVTVVATNDSNAAVLVEGLVVDLVYGPDQTSAAPLSGPGVVRFAGEIAPRASQTGVYVFDVPVDQRAEVSVVVSYLASVSPVVFTGPAPTP
ncbi:MAG: hypothetical protein KDB40_03425 [Acidimicrobiales bacterium]|nr:hypothetical protein [Acidimicrobiales bacterium]MCB9392609.1 hypothetical protein [Acidimicrobiaceae bacterium]